MIPYGRQAISQQDIDAVTEVLRSDFLTQGGVVPQFENAISEYCHAKHVVAVNSATSALHLACLALDLGPGDWVWTSPNTFVASANCARYCGASVDFVDIDPLTLNMSVEQLASKLRLAERTGKLPKVVIPVHFSGEPCDMEAIHQLARQYGFKIIEDASHAIGAKIGGSSVGDCRYSDITVFSFHPVKIITTGEGGAACTESAQFARKMQLLRSHGITREPAEMRESNLGGWYYEQHALGFNYRMTDIHAALGVSQMSQIENWIERRHQLAVAYDQAFTGLPIQLPRRAPENRSALHLFTIQVSDRRRVFEALRNGGIGVNVHYIPVHLQPDFSQFGFKAGDYPASEAYYSRTISLPMFASLTDTQQQNVIEAVTKVVK